MSRRYLFTGSRNWRDIRLPEMRLMQIYSECRPDNTPFVIVHGDCPTGLDAIVKELCWEFRFDQEPHPADWKLGKGAGLARNREMVSLGAYRCYAFPHEDSLGTAYTMKIAEEAGIEVITTREHDKHGNWL